MASNKIHYAWFILVGCCVFMGGLVGITLGCTGVFYRPISQTLKIGLQDVALYTTFMTIARTVGLPFMGKIMPKFDIRASLFVIVLMMCGGFALLSIVNSPIQLYLIGSLVGLASGGALYMTVPTLLHAWFKERIGFVMGVASACSGIGTAIFNPIASNIVSVVGWRTGARIMALISFVLVVPVALFVLRSKPEAKGLAPYGAKESGGGQGSAAATGLSAKESWSFPAFYLILLIVLAVAYISSSQNHMASFAVSAGIPAAQSGFAVSVCSLGSIIGGPILGALSDKIGAIKAMAIIALAGIAGGILGAFTGTNITLVFASAFLFGLYMPLLTVGMPLLVRRIFGTKSFSEIYSRIMSVNSFLTAVSVFAIGAIYEMSGGAYTHAFLISSALALLCAVILFPLEKLRQKMQVGI
jgi:MFS family permease